MLHELVHVVHQGVLALQHLTPSPAPSPAPKADGGSGSFAGLAALIASIAGLVSAIGAIMIGLRKRDGGSNSAAADKAIEYLIKQNRELLKERKGDKA